MAKRMLIDAAHPEETRVVVLNGTRLEEFDFESSTKKQVKGNIYLAKVTRVEPSLQAAFVDYGGNRHGFLAFTEIHPDYYRIPVSDRRGGEVPAPAMDIPVDLPDGVSAFAPAGGSPEPPDEMPGEVPGEIPGEMAGAVPGELSGEASAGVSDENSGAADELDESSAQIAAALPEAVPPRHSAADEAEDEDEDEEEEEPEVDDEGAQGAQNIAEDSGSAEFVAGPLADADEPAGEVAEVEMVAPIEAVVLSDPFFESVAPEASSALEEVDTLDDDDAAEEAGAERRRAPSLRHYKIQEVIKRRQIMLVQVAKEERGNKGAALTTYLSLAGRYCVLMPNTARGGGVSRKITSLSDRRRLKEILEELEIPEGMGVIVRTAGSERSKAEIRRDYEYLMRLWGEIRELTLKSTAPALIYEEGNLIKRAIRDLYARDIDEVVVDGDEGYRTAKTFMRMLMPSHAKRVQQYRDPLVGLFQRHQVESQIDAVHSPVAQLRSGGYIVINQTEALVSIDVNSGRATRERNIEETALRTNLEAAEEIARQLRLRDLAGLIVIDYIDMEEHRHNLQVERRLKDALKNDRARIQVGRISPFGLLEMSRQRLRPSLAEASTQPCPHCGGTGFIRSTESTALHVLRAIEEEGARARSAEIAIYVSTGVALYILNQKRASLSQIELRYGLRVTVGRDDALVPPNFRLERLRTYAAGEAPPPRVAVPPAVEIDEDDVADDDEDAFESAGGEGVGAERAGAEGNGAAAHAGDDERGSRRRRRRRGRRGEERGERRPGEERGDRQRGEEARNGRTAELRAGEADGSAVAGAEAGAEAGAGAGAGAEASERDGDGEAERRRRRRGRRGGRWRGREDGAEAGASAAALPEAGEEAAAETLVEAAIEGAEIPLVEPEPQPELQPATSATASFEHAPSAPAEPEPPQPPPPPHHEAEAERRYEPAVSPATFPEAVHDVSSDTAAERDAPRELEPVGAVADAAAEDEAPPELQPSGAPSGRASHAPAPGVDVYPVTEKPAAPRRGWWQRLIQ